MSKKIDLPGNHPYFLQQFWNDQGCMLMQAYDNEKVRDEV